MPFLRILNLDRPDIAELRVKVCDNFFSRFRGLMLTAPLSPSAGVLIDEKTDSRINAAIHMFFMNYDLAIVWIDSTFAVVGTTLARRWQPYAAPARPARYILEIHPARIADFQPGDRVKYQDD